MNCFARLLLALSAWIPAAIYAHPGDHPHAHPHLDGYLVVLLILAVVAGIALAVRLTRQRDKRPPSE